MSGGGSDKSRAGFTSRVVVLTETDGMDQAGATSRESDKVTQLEARTRAYGNRKRIYMECTVSTEGGRIWQEYLHGRQSKVPDTFPPLRGPQAIARRVSTRFGNSFGVAGKYPGHSTRRTSQGHSQEGLRRCMRKQPSPLFAHCSPAQRPARSVSAGGSEQRPPIVRQEKAGSCQGRYPYALGRRKCW